MCTNIELRVVETPEPESGSTYRVQLPGTDAECEFMFHPDLAERQELRYIMQGISRGDVGEEFVRRLKDYGTKLYKLLFGGAVGEEFRRLSQTGFRLWLHLPPRVSKRYHGSTLHTKENLYSKAERTSLFGHRPRKGKEYRYKRFHYRYGFL